MLKRKAYTSKNQKYMETFVTPDHLSSLPVAEQLRYVKRGLRGVMNGPVSEQMRNMGLTYRVNFGVELPRLREMSAELPHTYDLAAALWKEDIRECRLLAAMLMPSEAFTEDLAEVWVEQMRFPEEAQCTVQHLFARRPYAGAAAFRWIAREERMFRLCGWLLLSRLMMNGAVPAPRDVDALLDHAATELAAADRPLAAAAHRALLRLAETDEENGKRVEALFARFGI